MVEGWKLFSEEKAGEVPEKLTCVLSARIRMDTGDLKDFLFFLFVFFIIVFVLQSFGIL